MVAVCDVLGFSNLVKEQPLQEVVDTHIENLQTAIHSIILLSPEHVECPSEEDIFRQGLVGYVAFSDTIVIYSFSDNRDGYRAVINAVFKLLARHIFWPALRFRIGIDYGEFHADPSRNIYVGRALVGAHDLEKRQDWCGATLTDAAAQQIPDQKVDRYILIKYDVPMRKGNRLFRESHLAINWTLANHDVISQDYGWFQRGYAIPATSDQQAIERKLRNTEQFHLDKCVQCRAVRRKIT